MIIRANYEIEHRRGDCPMADYIAVGFLELADRKNIKSITVKDIINHCGISRQTFYNYFLDKYDLMNHIYKSTADLSIRLFSEGQISLRDSIFLTLKCCREKRSYYSDLAGYNTQNNFRDYCFLSSITFYHTYIINHYGKNAMDSSMERAIHFNCAGATHLFISWIEAGMVETPDCIADMIMDFMPDMMKEKMLA